MKRSDIILPITTVFLISLLILVPYKNASSQPLELVNKNVKIPVWKKDEQASKLAGEVLIGIWIKEDGSEGWAVGDNGVILRYKDGTWKKDEQASNLAGGVLIGIWIKEDGSEGWAVGDNGVILRYKDGTWEKDEQASALTKVFLLGIWIKKDGSEGWAGGGGGIMRYKDGTWKKYEQASKVAGVGFIGIWIKKDGSEGWAGGGGGILRYKDGTWKIYEQTSNLAGGVLIGIWIKEDGSEGWAVGNEVILRYKDGTWKKDKQASALITTLITPIEGFIGIWIKEDGSEGWAVGDKGLVLRYKDGTWKKDEQASKLAGENLYGIWIKEDGSEGWAVGDSVILHYRTDKVGGAMLISHNEDDLKLLKEQSLILDKKVFDEPIIQLICGGGNRLGDNYEISAMDNSHTQFKIKFVNVSNLLKVYEGEECRIRVIANYNLFYPIKAIFESPSMFMVAPPLWYTGLKILGAILGFNLVMVFLSIPIPWVRRVMLHPVGSAVLGLIVGKYLITDFLTRFVYPIKLAMFRDYRKNLKTAPALKEWGNRLYIPPHIEIPEEVTSTNEQAEDEWKKVFGTILTKPKKRLWLVLGKSGLGKTALMEKWTDYALTLKKTPVLVPLGSDLSTQEEVAASMAQYGDIDVKPEVAFDLLKGGGFVILLDGFNEDHNPGKTREFVRQVSKRNHVVMTSQVDPKWGKFFEIHNIKLEPFGREQLKQLMDETWIDKLLNTEYLADMAQLPHTAQLLADYIKENEKLPDFRLDIYRNLRKSFDDDTQILNLENTAWERFKANKKSFQPDDKVTEDLYKASVSKGILTRAGADYLFRHERIHRFFVASYLYRQDRQTIETWYDEVESGLGRGYWIDTLELWGELYAEAACKNKTNIQSYYDFLKEAADFSPQIFAERLFPQITRLYDAGLIEKDQQFFEWSAKFLAKVEVAA